MAMGKRRQRLKALLVMADGMPRSPGHPLFQNLNALLAVAEFDHYIECRCERYYEPVERHGKSTPGAGQARVAGR